MKIFETKSDLKSFLAPFISTKTIGFVPTMGALHDGHLSLIRKALEENEIVVMSIFVNPTQFNNIEDLEKYPRTLESDIQKIQNISSDIIIFAPTTEEMYNENISAEKFDFGILNQVMEGTSRAGHFDGVGTIVKKLFEIVMPTNAYFGEKDFQQILIIKSMVKQTNLPVNIIACPIIREANGLAMSSRNQRLSSDMKEKAALIYQSLQEAKKMFSSGEDIKTIENWIKSLYKLHSEFQLEYFTIADAETLEIVSQKEKNKQYRAFIVVHTQGVRLIDNIDLN